MKCPAEIFFCCPTCSTEGREKEGLRKLLYIRVAQDRSRKENMLHWKQIAHKAGPEAIKGKYAALERDSPQGTELLGILDAQKLWILDLKPCKGGKHFDLKPCKWGKLYVCLKNSVRTTVSHACHDEGK